MSKSRNGGKVPLFFCPRQGLDCLRITDRFGCIMTRKIKKYCSNVTLLAIGKNDTDATLTRVRCKSWSCEYCARINRIQWTQRIIRGMHAIDAKNVWFMTFTSSAWAHGRGETLRQVQRDFSKMIKRMKRMNERSCAFAYVRVYEQHESLAWHIHMIINWKPEAKQRTNKKYIYKKTGILNVQKWIRDNLVSCGFGYQFDAVRIDTKKTNDETAEKPFARIAGYITKYMTKSLMKTTEEQKYKRMRIIQASQNIPPDLMTDLGDMEWRVKQTYNFDDYVSDGANVYDSQRGAKIKTSDFTEQGFYMDEKYINVETYE